VILQIVLPTARAGLITAAILGVARTAGETAEVLFTAGGNVHYNFSPLAPYQSDLPLQIFSLINQPSINAIRVAWGVAFVLVALVLVLFVSARAAGRAGTGGVTRRLRTRQARRTSTS
jgi:phosphate transport system permease protein